MKLHITTINGIEKDSPIYRKQKICAEALQCLGVNEMGICSFDSKDDTPAEFSKRIDGIIASVEASDILFFQLPTGNGAEFDLRFISKVKAYPNSKVILVFHDMPEYENLSVLNYADGAIVSGSVLLKDLKEKGLNIADTRVSRITDNTDALLIQKYFLDIAGSHISEQKKTESGDSIHICFAVHDKTGDYTAFVGTTILSILDHTDADIVFHVLHDNSLSSSNIRKLLQTTEGSGSIIRFHRLNPDNFKVENERIGLYSVASLYRLAIPDLLPELKKVLYLDADILCNRDIKELWDTDINDYAIAAVHDIGFERGITPSDIVLKGQVDVKKYFNSGVLYMNLDKIRSMGNLLEMALDFLSEHKNSMLPDQDALNYIFKDSLLLLDPAWNAYTRYERMTDNKLRPCMYHFMGEKIIIFSDRREYDHLLLKTKARTPWGYDPVDKDWAYGMSSAYYHVDMLQKLVSSLSTKKKHIYIGLNTLGMRELMKLVPPKSGDYFVEHDPIVDEDGTRFGFPVKDFSAIEKEIPGLFTVFVLPTALNGTAIRKLEEMGLNLGEDFFVIQSLLNVQQGGFL